MFNFITTNSKSAVLQNVTVSNVIRKDYLKHVDGSDDAIMTDSLDIICNVELKYGADYYVNGLVTYSHGVIGEARLSQDEMIKIIKDGDFSFDAFAGTLDPRSNFWERIHIFPLSNEAKATLSDDRHYGSIIDDLGRTAYYYKQIETICLSNQGEHPAVVALSELQRLLNHDTSDSVKSELDSTIRASALVVMTEQAEAS